MPLLALLYVRQFFFRNLWSASIVGVKYEWRTRDDIVSIAEGLSNAAANLTTIAVQMTQHDMQKVLLTWVQRHWEAYDIITSVSAACVSLMPAQIDAKKQNRPPGGCSPGEEAEGNRREYHRP